MQRDRERTVDWSGFGGRGSGADAASTADGLRERKKRMTRQQLSDTATELFLAQGFDTVRVSEIAEACGVSEKTVFNYFPTKEALILDRLQTAPEDLRAALTDPNTPPVQAVLNVLSADLSAMTTWMARQPDYPEAVRQVARFGALIGSTPSLRAYQHSIRDRLTAQAAELLADRHSLKATDEVTALVAANALIGLWQAQFAALGVHLGRAATAAELFDAVTADVRRAAVVVQDGLASWDATAGPA